MTHFKMTSTFLLAVLTLVVPTSIAKGKTMVENAASATLQIGVYDSRAVATAHYRSVSS